MQKNKACKTCRMILEHSDNCPICKTSQLTTNWKGVVVVINPEKSKIAKKLGITTPGKYAIRLAK